MRFVIVTGMSGAGKSTAMKMLEDFGYFCVDNLPIALIKKFADLSFDSKGKIDKVALGVDIRSGNVNDLERVLDEIPQKEIFFIDAGDETLIKRFKETRRTHPLVSQGRVDEGIALERKELKVLKERADYIVNTDNLLTRDLRSEMEKIFVENKDYKNLFINILSFGFKYGIPVDSDLVFDVRFMPNPYYEEDLKHKTGNDKEVQDFVLSSPVSGEFLAGYDTVSDPELYCGGKTSVSHQHRLYRRKTPVGYDCKPPVRMSEKR